MEEEKIKKYNRYAEAYLESYYKYAKSTTIKELEYFKSLNLDLDKSYFILCTNYDLLKRFIAKHLLRKERIFKTYNAYDYTTLLVENSSSMIYDTELLILHYHNSMSDRGKTMDWVNSTILNVVVSRLRNNLPTIVTSEKQIEYFKDNRDIEYVVLPDKIGNRSSAQTEVKSIVSDACINTGSYCS